jgi:hypothetical protein
MAEEIIASIPTMIPPASGVTVRMYRPRGLGDCFLLAFRAVDGTARYMLIDCGVLSATKGGSARLKKIAHHIAQATGNRLHILVATHQHWDHLSGFQFAKPIFDTMRVDEVWLAWPEDPSHPLARRLRDKHASALRALGAAIMQLKAADDPQAALIEDVLAFHGGIDAALGLAGTAGQMEYLQTRSQQPRYCRPGDAPLAIPGVEGVRIFVLGPPEDEALLSRSNPSTQDSEVYEQALALDQATCFYMAALDAQDPSSLSDEEREQLERSQPFDRTESIPLDDADQYQEHDRFFRTHYGFGDDGEGHGPQWRRIGTDWLQTAGGLALDLDGDTNNTSLVLAIELTPSGKVLLFPADAQVGNWLSWNQVSWTLHTDEGETAVGGSDLIRRTVFYKTGHHGSHNATLRQKGLELMHSSELVAMIPVDEKQAATRGTNGWSMPFPPLEERLRQKTRGRIIRADTGLPKRPASIAPSEWEAFEANVAEDPSPDKLWVQYTVPE